MLGTRWVQTHSVRPQPKRSTSVRPDAVGKATEAATTAHLRAPLAVTLFASGAVHVGRKRRSQRWRVRIHATKARANAPPPLSSDMKAVLRPRAIAKPRKIKQPDEHPWRFKARGGDWIEALHLMENAKIPLEALDFAFVIQACAKAQSHRNVLKLLRDAEELGLKLDAQAWGSAFTAAMSSKSKTKETLMKRVLQSPARPDTLDAKAYAAAIAAFESHGDTALVLELFAEALKVEAVFEVPIYVLGMKACEAEGSWELALSAMSQILRHGVVQQLDARMIATARAACVKAEKWDLVRQLSSDYLNAGGEPDAFHYSVEMLALQRQGLRREAMKLFEDMISRSVTPNQYVYSGMMGDGSDPDAWPLALALLQDCKHRGIALDAVLFGKALRNLAAADQWEIAVQLLDEMAASVGVTSPALASTVASCGGGQWEAALALLASAQRFSVKQDAELWNSAMYACAAAGRVRKAEDMLTAMQVEKLEPTVESYNTCLEGISQSSSSSKQLKNWLQKMREENVHPNTVTLNAGIDVFAQTGAWEEALAFASDLRQQEIQPNQITYGALISTCKETRHWPAALALLEDLLSHPSLPPSVTVFNIAISVCEACNDGHHLAIHLLRRIPSYGLQPDLISYNTVLAACQNAGEWRLALQLFQEMEASPHLVPDAYTYSSVISACDLGEQWEWAVNLWRRMEAQDIVASDIIFNSLVSVCKKCEQQAWVDYFLAEMEHRGLDKSYITMSAAFGALPPVGTEEPVATEEALPAAEEDQQEAKMSGEDVKVFMDKLEGASHLFAEALQDGAFAPWIREGRLLDLHGMSTEVAKVAVYMALKGVPDLPEDDLAFSWGLKIIVGRGLHSENGEVVLAPAVRQLLEEVFHLRVTEKAIGSVRVVAEDLWTIRQQGSWPQEWLKEGQEPPKSWLKRKDKRPQQLRVANRLHRAGKAARRK